MPINLLPDELKPKSGTLKVSKKLRKVAIFMFVGLALFSIVTGGAVLVLSNLIKNSETKKTELTTQIDALKQTEARLVLIKDRLAKISSLNSSRVIEQKAQELKNISLNISPNIKIEGASVAQDEFTFNISFGTPADLKDFINLLTQDQELKDAKLENVIYTDISGFKAEFSI